MSLARGLARGLASGVARGVAGVSSSSFRFDADALDYFSRFEGLGGSFDQTGINASYTETYIKRAISDFIVGCKDDLIWTKLTEVYLLAGGSFAGLMAKLKHAGTSALTNVNFVSGDYVAVGNVAGLAGKVSGHLKTSLPQNALSASSRGLASYETVYPSSPFSVAIGSDGPVANENMWSLHTTNPVDNRTYSSSIDIGGPSVLGATAGFWSGNSISSTILELYKNGSRVAFSSHTAATPTNLELYVGALNRNNGATDSYSGRQSLVIVKLAMSEADEANLYTRVNALMTDLGANV